MASSASALTSSSASSLAASASAASSSAASSSTSFKIEAYVHLYWCNSCHEYPFERTPPDPPKSSSSPSSSPKTNSDQIYLPWNVGVLKRGDKGVEERSIYCDRKDEFGNHITRYPKEISKKLNGVWECRSDNTIAEVTRKNLAQDYHDCPKSLKNRFHLGHGHDKTEKKDKT